MCGECKFITNSFYHLQMLCGTQRGFHRGLRDASYWKFGNFVRRILSLEKSAAEFFMKITSIKYYTHCNNSIKNSNCHSCSIGTAKCVPVKATTMITTIASLSMFDKACYDGDGRGCKKDVTMNLSHSRSLWICNGILCRGLFLVSLWVNISVTLCGKM